MSDANNSGIPRGPPASTAQEVDMFARINTNPGLEGIGEILRARQGPANALHASFRDGCRAATHYAEDSLTFLGTTWPGDPKSLRHGTEFARRERQMRNLARGGRSGTAFLNSGLLALRKSPGKFQLLGAKLVVGGGPVDQPCTHPPTQHRAKRDEKIQDEVWPRIGWEGGHDPRGVHRAGPRPAGAMCHH